MRNLKAEQEKSLVRTPVALEERLQACTANDTGVPHVNEGPLSDRGERRTLGCVCVCGGGGGVDGNGSLEELVLIIP